MPAISRAVMSEIPKGRTDDLETDGSIPRTFFERLYMDRRLPDPFSFSKAYLQSRCGDDHRLRDVSSLAARQIYPVSLIVPRIGNSEPHRI